MFFARFSNLRPLANTLTANNYYLLFIMWIYCYHFKCNYWQTKKIFSIFIAFLKITSAFEHFEKKKKNEPHRPSSYEVIDFKTGANLNTSKHFPVWTFWKWRANKFQKLMKPLEKSIHPTISSICAKLREKRFFLAGSCSLGLLANRFTANNLLSYSDKVNLLLPFQMHLSKKLKRFS